MMNRAVLVFFSCFVFAACGAQDEDDPKVGDLACPPYQAPRGHDCVEVEVLGVESKELSFTRKGITLHGTLTLPKTEADYRPPVFVLAHGSGPNDRDETATGSLGFGYGQEIRTFGLLAHALSMRGAAVYRYDKRTCFKENSAGRCPNLGSSIPPQIIESFLVDDFIEDFREAVRTVAALPEVDGSNITVVGHSQGANFVPLLMADEPGVVAGVLLAGISTPVDEAVVYQMRVYADDLEARRPDLAKEIDDLRKAADAKEAALAAIRAGTFTEPTYDNVSLEFWRNWMERTDNLEEEFLRVDGPMLLMNGTLDFNVPVSHLERYREWAEAAGRSNAEFVVLPDVTHAFVTVIKGGSDIDPNFSPAALEALTTWHRGLDPR